MDLRRRREEKAKEKKKRKWTALSVSTLNVMRVMNQVTSIVEAGIIRCILSAVNLTHLSQENRCIFFLADVQSWWLFIERHWGRWVAPCSRGTITVASAGETQSAADQKRSPINKLCERERESVCEWSLTCLPDGTWTFKWRMKVHQLKAPWKRKRERERK